MDACDSFTSFWWATSSSLVGVGLALWKAGVLARVSPVWIAIGGLIALGVGIMLAVSSGKPGGGSVEIKS